MRRLSGGIRAFLIAPDDEEHVQMLAPAAEVEAQKRRGKVPQKSPIKEKKSSTKSKRAVVRAKEPCGARGAEAAGQGWCVLLYNS